MKIWKYENGRPSTCGGHVWVARVGGVVPLQWMRRYRACWEVGRWVRVAWWYNLVKRGSHFAMVIHSWMVALINTWMVALIHSWLVVLMIFWPAWCSTTQSPTWPTRVVAPAPRVSWLGFYLPGVQSENKNRGQNCLFVEVDATIQPDYWVNYDIEIEIDMELLRVRVEIVFHLEDGELRKREYWDCNRDAGDDE